MSSRGEAPNGDLSKADLSEADFPEPEPPAGPTAEGGTDENGASGEGSENRETGETGETGEQSETGEAGTHIDAADAQRAKIRKRERLEELMRDTVAFHDAALSENTLRAYRTGWSDFVAFCDSVGCTPLPATPATVGVYITDCLKPEDDGGKGHAVATVRQRLAAIDYYHAEAGEKSPTKDRAVRKVLRGARREMGQPQDEAPPLLTRHIKAMVDALDGGGRCPTSRRDPAEMDQKERGAFARWVRGVRNRALILIGYAGAFRRSELVGLQVADAERHPQGLYLRITQSKTDQMGEGEGVPIRYGSSGYCPVEALDRWLNVMGEQSGPIFRSTSKSGRILDTGLTGRTVSSIIKRAAGLAGLANASSYSGHSLRAGHISQAKMNGVPNEIIMNQSRHSSYEAFLKYVRSHEAMESTSSQALDL
jgi:integrase